MKKEVVIYTDGACRGNPGPGGWAALLIYGSKQKEICGRADATTNQRMELTAAIKGLQCLKEPCRVSIYTDSAYLVNAFIRGWLVRWQRNGWQTTAGRPVENQDLWRELLRLCGYHDVQWHKVAGHSNDDRNNRCDALARRAIDS
ncbi:MAG: ribonuclease HI [Bacillota bacterium]